MRLDQELRFLCDVLKKSHVRTETLSPRDRLQPLRELGAEQDNASSLGELIGEIEEKTKYRLTTEAWLCYQLLRLPLPGERCLLLIGPYLTRRPSDAELLLLGERLGLAPSAHRVLAELYSALPTVSDGDRLLAVIDTFCEHVWQ